MFDLGLNVGWAALESGKRPIAGSFRIQRRAQDLGGIAVDFEQRAAELFAEHRPDVVGRAARFINKFSNPVAIGPYFGLSMKLDEMAVRRRLPHYEVAEQDARKAFLDRVPRGSIAQKRAVIAACYQRGWWAADDHGCDAQCVGVHILGILEPERSHEATPLFQAHDNGGMDNGTPRRTRGPMARKRAAG